MLLPLGRRGVVSGPRHDRAVPEGESRAKHVGSLVLEVRVGAGLAKVGGGAGFKVQRKDHANMFPVPPGASRIRSLAASKALMTSAATCGTMALP